MNESKSPAPTPEELLQMLEVQLQMQRAKRQRTSGNRTAIRVGGIFLIFGAALAAVLILQYAMSQASLRERVPKASVEREMPGGRNF